MQGFFISTRLPDLAVIAERLGIEMNLLAVAQLEIPAVQIRFVEKRAPIAARTMIMIWAASFCQRWRSVPRTFGPKVAATGDFASHMTYHKS